MIELDEGASGKPAPQLLDIALAAIAPSPHNPRHFGPSDAKDPALVSLSESIAELGVLSPVVVRPLTEAGRYELVAGERRFRASKLAKKVAIPCLVRPLSDLEALELTVTENLQREDLHPLEEAAGVASLLAAGETIDQVADKLGKPKSWVARRARLTNLSPAWKKLAADHGSPVSQWPAASFELMARLEQTVQESIAKNDRRQVESHGWNTNDLRKQLSQYSHELSLAPWDPNDATLDAKAGACAACPKRSSHHPGLFDDEPVDGKVKTSGDRCLDAICWARKAELVLEGKYRDAKAEHPNLQLVAGDTYHNAPVPAFAKGKKTLDRWGLEEAKKGEAGAIVAFWINGQNVGKLAYYRKPKAASSSSGRSGKAGAGTGDAPKKKSMAEKRSQLEARRQSLAMDATIKALKATKPPATAVLLVFLRAFGTADNHRHPFHSGGTLGTPKGILQAKAVDHSAFLWKSVVDVISDRWDRTRRWQGTGGVVKLLSEISAVCDLAKVDQVPFYAAAVKELPEPKSWSKAAPAKKAAKKSKPKK